METQELNRINSCYALAKGYQKFYSEWLDNIKVTDIEMPFSVSLRNPISGYSAHSAELAGKIDKIISINGNIWILDHKSTSRMPERDMLKMSPQGDTYMIALKEKGIQAKGIIWDYIRKPTIKMTQKETPETYKERLLADIDTRPEFYFTQFQIQRWDSDIEATQSDIWQCHKTLQTYISDKIFPRYTCACQGLYGMCNFVNLCSEDNEFNRKAFYVSTTRGSDAPEFGKTNKRRESNSSLNTFRKCPRLYYWQYMERLKPVQQNDALVTGTTIHDALDCVYSKKSLEEWLYNKINSKPEVIVKEIKEEEEF